MKSTQEENEHFADRYLAQSLAGMLWDQKEYHLGTRRTGWEHDC